MVVHILNWVNVEIVLGILGNPSARFFALLLILALQLLMVELGSYTIIAFFKKQRAVMELVEPLQC